MVRHNLPAVSMGSVEMEHPDPMKMGAVWFCSLFVQNLKYTSEAPSVLHCGVGQWIDELRHISLFVQWHNKVKGEEF